MVIDVYIILIQGIISKVDPDSSMREQRESKTIFFKEIITMYK